MHTKNLNEAVLELHTIINRIYPRGRSTENGPALRAAITEMFHSALEAQLGVVDGDPRDLLKLALKHCGEQGVPLQDVAELINVHQEAHAGMQGKAS